MSVHVERTSEVRWNQSVCRCMSKEYGGLKCNKRWKTHDTWTIHEQFMNNSWQIKTLSHMKDSITHERLYHTWKTHDTSRLMIPHQMSWHGWKTHDRCTSHHKMKHSSRDTSTAHHLSHHQTLIIHQHVSTCMMFMIHESVMTCSFLGHASTHDTSSNVMTCMMSVMTCMMSVMTRITRQDSR